VSDHAGPEAFDETMPMEIQNGESISGWQYLHGTDDDAGGFNFRGSTDVIKVDGGYEVQFPPPTPGTTRSTRIPSTAPTRSRARSPRSSRSAAPTAMNCI